MSLLFWLIVPSDWVSNPAITRSKVVFPHPDGPSMQTNSLSSTPKLTSLRA